MLPLRDDVVKAVPGRLLFICLSSFHPFAIIMEWRLSSAGIFDKNAYKTQIKASKTYISEL